LPRGFWGAKGRRRLVLAYCRTIHKAQGATYRGASFTLAGDDSIHLEATHVALSRGTEANFLYYWAKGRPDEDYHKPEVDQPQMKGLVAAVAHSRAQILAIDHLQADVQRDEWRPVAGDWAQAPMTEAQVAVLARAGQAPGRQLSWVEASLLIDQAMGLPRGGRARTWLREGGGRPGGARPGRRPGGARPGSLR